MVVGIDARCATQSERCPGDYPVMDDASGTGCAVARFFNRIFGIPQEEPTGKYPRTRIDCQ
jgi:hypothetical protein